MPRAPFERINLDQDRSEARQKIIQLAARSDIARGSSMGNVSFNVTPPPVGTQTSTGELSVNCSVVNQSGTAVEVLCSFIRRGTTERKSQILAGNFNGDIEFAFPNVARNDTYGIVLSLNTSDSSIKISGTYTVMMTDQR